MKNVSIHLMLLFITSPSPNVVISEKFQYISCYSLSSFPVVPFVQIRQFQYISCYSLSDAYLETIDISTKFQYISCYSLSALPFFQELPDQVSIHLMLLFIQMVLFRPDFCVMVSIHLMLLFIDQTKEFVHAYRRFQYISCYSLSSKNKEILFSTKVSIHLMLLFILW